MIFGDILLDPWESHGCLEWRRYHYMSKSNILYMDNLVSIIKVWSRYKEGHAWYPEFKGKLEFIQKIYDTSTNFKEFNYLDDKIAMDYTDNFLIRLHKLRIFS